MAFGFSLKLLDDNNLKRIEKLDHQNALLKTENNGFESQYEYWTIEGQVNGDLPEKTKLFIDCRSTHFASTGDFSSTIYLRKEINSRICSRRIMLL